MSSELKTFVTSLLSRSKIAREWIGMLTTQKALHDIQNSFTTARWDYEHNQQAVENHIPNNLENHEFNGDRLVNFIIAEYIRKEYPDITNISRIDNMNKYMKSTIGLSSVAKFLKVEPFVRCSNEELLNGEISARVLDDCMESLVYCIYSIVSKNYEQPVGLAFQICYEVLSYCIRETILAFNINLRDDKIIWKSQVTRKEFHDSMAWPDGVRQIENNDEYTVNIYAWKALDMEHLKNIGVPKEDIDELIRVINIDLGIKPSKKNPSIYYLSQHLVKLYEKQEGDEFYFELKPTPGYKSRDVTASLAMIYMLSKIVRKSSLKLKFSENFTRAPTRINEYNKDEFVTYFGLYRPIASVTIDITKSTKDEALTKASADALKILRAPIQEGGYGFTINEKGAGMKYTYRANRGRKIENN